MREHTPAKAISNIRLKRSFWFDFFCAALDLRQSWIANVYLFGVWLDPLPLLPDDAVLLWLHEGVVIGALNVVGLLLTLPADPVVSGIGDVAELASVILNNVAVGLRIDVLTVVGSCQRDEDAQQQEAQNRSWNEDETESLGPLTRARKEIIKV